MAAEPARPEGAVFLQVGVTIVAIALALATVVEDKGPHVQDFYFVPAGLLVVGLIALFATLLAMAAIWEASGLRLETDILFGGFHTHPNSNLQGFVYHSIIASTWSLWALAAIYVVLLYTRAF